MERRFERTAKLRSRLDGILRPGIAVEAVRQTRSVDSSPHPDVLLETVASGETPTRNAHSARRSATPGNSPRTQPPKLLAYVQNHCQRGGLTNAWLAEQGLLSLKTLWAELAPLR